MRSGLSRTSRDELSSLRPPSLAVPTLRLPLPADLLERSGDAALIGRANAGGFNSERMSANFANCHPGFGFDIIADVVLPNSASYRSACWR